MTASSRPPDSAARPSGRLDRDRRRLLSGLAGGALASSVPGLARAAAPGLSFSMATGAGGVPLNVVRAGRADGPEILFIHGMSQSYLSFAPQLQSALARQFKLVAFDLRGHGNSGKPWRPEDYAGSRLWADDIAAVIAAAGLKRPTIVAWSFGGALVMDYVRHYGVGGVAGVNLVSHLGGLVPAPQASSPRVARIWSQAPLRQSPDIAENIEGFRIAADGLSAHLSKAQRDIAFAEGMMQTGVVRKALTAKLPADNRDLIKGLTRPVLISVGTLDLFTDVASARAAAAALPRASVSVYEDTGHFISAEAPDRFDRELAAFQATTLA